MASKKASGLVGSSGQSDHPSSSRGIRKRARAEDQASNIHLPPSAEEIENQHETKELLPFDGSRLKKKRLSEPLERPAQGSQGEEDLRENATDLSDAIHSVANHCEQLIQHILKNHSIMRPRLDLIHEIVLVLEKTSAIKVLASVPNLPKILFIAAHLGVEEGTEANAATRTLVEALMHLAKIQTGDLPDFSTKKRRVRSAFVGDEYVDFTDMQIETAKKAGQWALELLSNCVRGASDSVASRKRIDYRNQFQHTGVSELFVLPRDKLDPILAARLVENSAFSLRNKMSVEQHPKQNLLCSRLSDTQLSAVLRHPLCSSLLDQLLLNAEKLYTSCLKCSSGKKPLEFISKVGQGVIQAGQQTFLELSSPSQMILLRHCKNVRLWHRQAIELALLTKDELFSLKEVRCISAPFANLIAVDVAVHWDLMDEVRKEVSRKSEPFNLLSWRLRPFYQAVFSEALRLIRSETVSMDYRELYHSGPAPLSKRFPTFLRSIVRFLETADKCFDLCNKPSEDAFQTAVLSLKFLTHFLRGTYGTYRISASVQAFLLCVESVLERISWMCAVWVEQEFSHGKKSENEWKQVIQDMAVVMCSIEVFRLPGGESAETDKTMNKRVREVELFLWHIVVNKSVVLSPNPKRAKINSLLAFWLSGLIFVRGLNGFTDAVNSMDRFEVQQILRSLEIVSSWTSAETSRDSCEICIRMLQRLIQSHSQ